MVRNGFWSGIVAIRFIWISLAENRLNVLRHIESGGYGDVYLGHNHATGEDVAVKIGHERSIEVIFSNHLQLSVSKF